MTCRVIEPTLSETLSDPVIRAVMKADGVDPAALAAELQRIACNLRQIKSGRSESI